MVSCAAFDGDEFGPEDKFAYIVIHEKPFNLLCTKKRIVNSEFTLRLYSGNFDLADFAELILDAGRDEPAKLPLPGATGPCFSTYGMADRLIGLPGSQPFEVGYSCFGCKAGLIQVHPASCSHKRAC